MFFSIWIYNAFEITMNYSIFNIQFFKFSNCIYFLKDGNNFLLFYSYNAQCEIYISFHYR